MSHCSHRGFKIELPQHWHSYIIIKDDSWLEFYDVLCRNCSDSLRVMKTLFVGDTILLVFKYFVNNYF